MLRVPPGQSIDIADICERQPRFGVWVHALHSFVQCVTIEVTRPNGDALKIATIKCMAMRFIRCVD